MLVLLYGNGINYLLFATYHASYHKLETIRQENVRNQGEEGDLYQYKPFQ